MRSKLFLGFIAVFATVLLGYMYADSLALLSGQWLGSDDYSHGLFVPLISAFLVWQARDRIAALQPGGLGRLNDGFKTCAALYCAAPLAILGAVLGLAGRRDAARQALEELRERSRHGYVAPVLLAMVHAGLGEVAEGIAVLERDASDRGGACVPAMIGPVYSAWGGDPRFGRMLRSIGYTGPWASPAGTGAGEIRPLERA